MCYKSECHSWFFFTHTFTAALLGSVQFFSPLPLVFSNMKESGTLWPEETVNKE